MIYTGTLLRAELYDDHVAPYTNVKAVYEAHKNKYPGKLIVTNAHWYTVSPKVAPTGNYKVTGTVLSKESWMDWGFGWNAGSLPVMVSTMGNDNYLSTLPVLVDGKRRDDVIDNQTSSVQRSTLRTWFGVDKAGKWYVEVTTSNYTLHRIVDRMQAFGIVDGMVLDGSGSSQCYDGTTYQRGDGRTIYSYLLLWFADDGGTEDDDTDDDKEDDTTGMKIYLSPSAQPANNYAAGDTNEQAQCNRIAEAAKSALERCGFAVRKAPEGQGYKDSVAESNAWGADLHIPIHTNAGGGAGTVVFVHGGTAKQMQYAKPIYDEVQAISPGTTDYGVRVNSGLYELGYTTATAVYVECEFHDRADLAAWIIEHTTELGEAIARGVCKGAGVTYIAPDAEPSPEPMPEPEPSEAELAREWAMAQGISDGENPDSPATRGQVWTMLYRMEGGEKDD